MLSPTVVLSRLALRVALLATVSAGLLTVGISQAQASDVSLTVHAQHIGVPYAAVPGNAANGYSPQELRDAYALPSRGASGQKIAIIDAFNSPYVAADLAAYAKNFGLPACTTHNGCLSIYNEAGKISPLPELDPTGGTWETEASIGTQVVHGVCETCKIMLFEADSTTSQDLSAAVESAAQKGATVAVTTFEPVESPTDTDYALDYSHAHMAVVSATGEAPDATYGYGGNINFPASLSSVLAVGGTDLKLGQTGYGSEQAWSDTVSGCSLYSLAAPWQVADAKNVGCGTMRAVADISANANPGVVIYASHLFTPGGPWYQATGTSVSAPTIAAEIGLAGSLGSAEAQDVYAHAKQDPGAFHHISRGKNAATCTHKICEAGSGYNGPTGLGTPDGLAAFLKTGGELPAGVPALTLSTNRATVGSNWKLAPVVENGMPIAVFGTVSVDATIGSQTVTLASHSLTLGSLAQQTTSMTINSRYRAALSAEGTVALNVAMRVHGVGGRTATVTRKLTVTVPRG